MIDVATGTIHLKATFANADERLWPGEFVSVRLILSTRQNAVTVPEQTVMRGPDGAYIYAIKPDDTVERRSVNVAATQDGRAVIEGGLTAGDRVAVDGQYRLTDGAKVTPSGRRSIFEAWRVDADGALGLASRLNERRGSTALVFRIRVLFALVCEAVFNLSFASARSAAIC